MSEDYPVTTPPDAVTEKPVVFDTPIVRGALTIEAVTLRKPVGRDLRGLQSSLLLAMDAEQLAKLVPRISSPPITEPEVDALDGSDVLKLGAAVVGFLLPSMRDDMAVLYSPKK